MSIAALGFVLAAAAPVQAAPYFPTGEGTVWTYEETVNGLKETFVDRVLAPVTLQGMEGIIPISTSGPSVNQEKTYYRVDGDTVWTVAYDGGIPLPKPVPVFTIGLKKTEWSFSGPVQFVRGNAQLDIKGNSKPGPEQDVLGTKRKTLLVEVSGTMTQQGGNKVTSTQTAVYAEGVGLVTFEQRAEANGFKAVRTRKLVKFQEAEKRS